MEGMTIKQIAEVAGVDRTTVVRWIGRMDRALYMEISAKCTEADKTKKPAQFTLEETLAIIRAGGRSTLADLLAQNAEAPPQNAEVIQAVAKLIQQFRLAKKYDLIDLTAAKYLGLATTPPPPPKVLMIPEVVSKEEAAARAIGRNILLKRARALETDKKQKRLAGFETII